MRRPHGCSRHGRDRRGAAPSGLPHREGRHPAHLRLLERGRRVRARRPVPAHGLPPPPRDGRRWAAHVPLAQRPLRPGLGRHARSLGRRRPCLPGGDRRRQGHRHPRTAARSVAVPSAPTRRGIGTRHPARHRQGGPRSPRRGRAAGGHPSGRGRLRHPKPSGGVGGRVDGPHRHGQRPTAPRLGGPRVGAGARTGFRLPRYARPAAPLPLAAAGRGRPGTAAGRPVPALRRHPVGRRGRAHAGLRDRHGGPPTWPA